MVDITWKKFEKDLHSDNVEVALKASDAFEKTRDLELRTSKAARDFEKSRKESAAKEKPLWVKERIKSQNKDLNDFQHNLRSWAGFDSEMQPTPNYLIVSVTEREAESKSGIILAGNDDFLRNDGTCVAIGEQYISPFNPQVIQPPCKAGDHILFKKGAGIDIEIKNQNYKFMTFQDVLAVFKDA